MILPSPKEKNGSKMVEPLADKVNFDYELTLYEGLYDEKLNRPLESIYFFMDRHRSNRTLLNQNQYRHEYLHYLENQN